MITEEQIILFAANKVVKMNDRVLSALQSLKIPVTYKDDKQTKHAWVNFEKTPLAGGGYSWNPSGVERI
ncbi:hypothetical protein [Mucilaginibacter jinjuensis]|uniref:Uncharacterized protein n=1 Tax=Mucilaginibacter jinjuensis TaxID=1176721 RepID=A0ABY7TAS3_9SPHI|nr:hypothetical protein [Mucilaginibacter jinjuensis]WCT13436.1 hypothetical protein PQO05_05750 [Mucilaginibacter jinjuensis]